MVFNPKDIRILFKHINNDGTEIFDNNYHFKVVR